MAELFAVHAATIRSDHLHLHHHQLSSTTKLQSSLSLRPFLRSKPHRVFSIDIGNRVFARARVVSDSVYVQGINIQPDNTGGDGGGTTGGGGGGGGDNNGGGDGGGEGDSDDDGDDDRSIKKLPMSMSQKLTLGYAALIGVGGVMGYLKSGSQKSLMAGGLSALLLYFVYAQLPSRPAFASSIGLGLSVALLGVMGSRYKKSGKIFPAGVVSFVSFVMSGGYVHGILRSLH